MKINKYTVFFVVFALIIFLMITLKFLNREGGSENNLPAVQEQQQINTNYRGPSGPPGEGFVGPTEQHP